MPVQYLGGKSKLAKHIATIIDSDRSDGEPLWDLCCGAANVIAAASDKGPRYAVDVVPCLVRLLCEVRDGTFVPPAEVSREHYAELKARAIANPCDSDPLLAFVGFGLSWGAKWFAGYATNASGRNYTRAAINKITKGAAALRGVEFICSAWHEQRRRISGTVYLDPPYAGTTGYRAAPAHDAAQFWLMADTLARQAHVRQVFVSEYTAPAHWYEIAQWEGHKDINRGTRIERLFSNKRSSVSPCNPYDFYTEWTRG